MRRQLEQYLEQVETRLVELPFAQRQSEVEEIRQHIEAMVASHQELGFSEEQAVTATLKQFGKSQTVGGELTRVHQRRPRFLPDNLLTATLCAMSCSVGGIILLFFTFVMIERNGLHLRFVDGCAPAVQIAFVYLNLLLGCLAAGGITGAAFPRRAVVSTALTYTVYIAIAIRNIIHLSDLSLSVFLQVCGFWTLLAVFTMLGAKAGAQRQKSRLRHKRCAA